MYYKLVRINLYVVSIMFLLEKTRRILTFKISSALDVQFFETRVKNLAMSFISVPRSVYTNVIGKYIISPSSHLMSTLLLMHD